MLFCVRENGHLLSSWKEIRVVLSSSSDASGFSSENNNKKNFENDVHDDESKKGERLYRA